VRPTESSEHRGAVAIDADSLLRLALLVVAVGVGELGNLGRGGEHLVAPHAQLAVVGASDHSLHRAAVAANPEALRHDHRRACAGDLGELPADPGRDLAGFLVPPL
jgi:hypothetical protein